MISIVRLEFHLYTSCHQSVIFKPLSSNRIEEDRHERSRMVNRISLTKNDKYILDNKTYSNQSSWGWKRVGGGGAGDISYSSLAQYAFLETQ